MNVVALIAARVKTDTVSAYLRPPDGWTPMVPGTTLGLATAI